MLHMIPRNRLYEMREAAAVAKNARIQNCARSPEKRPTSKFLLRNTQGTQIYVTNEGPGCWFWAVVHDNVVAGGNAMADDTADCVMILRDSERHLHGLHADRIQAS